ncbi:exocyst complex component 3-like protein 4 isoform X2 [Hemicordylus capensis]|nr:exocyst complex component 3-like protein 4 isoform X2 [Hemicordylus capensis]
MQINELIQKRQLLEAFENIRMLEMEVLAERDAKKYEENPKEYIMRAKDIDLLYDLVYKTIQCTVEETLDLPEVDAKALTSLVTLIEKEEKAHAKAAKIVVPSEPVDRLGSARNWRGLWKESVKESVERRVNKVEMPLKDCNASWLSVHLGYLKNVIRGDLKRIKHLVQKCYPQDYSVCETYLKAFHLALSFHLQSILENSHLEYNELHAVLLWVTQVYHSEDFLGHPDLQPDMKLEDLSDLLTSETLEKLKKDYVHSVKQKTKTHLDAILMLCKERWVSEELPETSPSSFHSSLSFDIQTMIGEHMKASSSICKHLEKEVIGVSLKEVNEFIPRFGNKFLECSKARDSPQFVPFMVAYINSFHDLKMGLQTHFNSNCEELEKIVTDLTLKYMGRFLSKLRLATQQQFKKILSRAWIVSGGTPEPFIMKILLVIEDFSKHLIHLNEPIQEDFLNKVHKYVIQEYVTQTLKPRGRMKRSKREEVSIIMTQEATMIHNTMNELGSSSDWLSHAIPYIAKIIGEKKRHNIKGYIEDLFQKYPDIRKKHIVAVLALRRLRRNTRKFIPDDMDRSLEELPFGSDRRLFADIDLPITIRCF